MKYRYLTEFIQSGVHSPIHEPQIVLYFKKNGGAAMRARELFNYKKFKEVVFEKAGVVVQYINEIEKDTREMQEIHEGHVESLYQEGIIKKL